MLSKLLPRSIYDVMAAVACFGVLAGGTAYAANTVFSSDIVDGEVKSVDIGNNEIGSADVKDNSINTFDVHSFLGVDVVDGSLEDQDVGQGTFTHFSASIGNVPAHDCVDGDLTGVNARLDHVLLSPDWNTADPNLSYTGMYTTQTGGGLDGFVVARVCNPTPTLINDGNTNFNLLVFDAE